MIYLTLGNGIQGVFHFIHHGFTTLRTEPDGTFSFEPHELYPTVARVNGELHTLGPTLLRTSLDLSFNVSALPKKIMVSALRGDGRAPYIVVVNTDVNGPVTALLSVPGAVVALRDLAAGMTFPVEKFGPGPSVPQVLRAPSQGVDGYGASGRSAHGLHDERRSAAGRQEAASGFMPLLENLAEIGYDTHYLLDPVSHGTRVDLGKVKAAFDGKERDETMLLCLSIAVLLAAPGKDTVYESSSPKVYLIDYDANHVDNPAYIDTIAEAPPDILHVGHDVVFKSHLGPYRGTGAFPETYELLSPEECQAEMERLKGYVDALHKAGARTVIPYICDVLVFGDHIKRTGYWEFYDHWDEYETFGFGKKPAEDPITWMQDDERRPVGKNTGMFVYEPCINHPVWRRYLLAVVRTIARCGYDGTFVDVNSFRCVNECCRVPFGKYLGERYSQQELKELFGFDSPESVRVAKGRREGLLGVESCRFRALSMADLFTTLQKEGEALRPGFLVLPNLSPMAHIDGVRARIGNGQDVARWGKACSWLMFEEMQQDGLFGSDTISDCVLQYKLAFAGGIRGGMLLYHATDPDGIALAMAEAGAGGGGGLIQPRYNCPDVRNRYAAFWRENRDVFEGLQPWSQVGVLYLQDELYWGNLDHARAVYRIRRHLSDEHVLFDFIVEQNFNPKTLRRYQVVIMPEARYLSENQIKTLKDYVTDGGILVVVGDCGTFNEVGKGRPAEPFKEWSVEPMEHGNGSVFAAGKGRCALVDAPSSLSPAHKFELYTLDEDEANDVNLVLRLAKESAETPRVPSPLLDLLKSLGKADVAIADADVPWTVRVSAFTKEGPSEASLVMHVVNYNVPIHGEGKSGPVVMAKDLDFNVPLPSGWRVSSVEALEPGVERQTLSFIQAGDRVRLEVPHLAIYRVLHIRCARSDG